MLKLKRQITWIIIFQFFLNWFFAVPLAIAVEAPTGPASIPGISKECQDLSVSIPKKIEEFKNQFTEYTNLTTPGQTTEQLEAVKQSGELAKRFVQRWAINDCGKNEFQILKQNWLNIIEKDYNPYVGRAYPNFTISVDSLDYDRLKSSEQKEGGQSSNITTIDQANQQQTGVAGDPCEGLKTTKLFGLVKFPSVSSIICGLIYSFTDGLIQFANLIGDILFKNMEF